MKKIQPITKQLLDTLDSYDRTIAIRNHHKWLKKVRNQDKGVMYRQRAKECCFKYRERIRTYRECSYLMDRRVIPNIRYRVTTTVKGEIESVDYTGRKRRKGYA